MPELPEVERGRKIAAAVAQGRKIKKVWCDDDLIVFDNTKPARIRKALTGRQVLAVCRHGKQLWFELDKRPWPTFHFGMTGSFRTPQHEVLALESHPASKGEGWPPRFAKIRIWFDDGGELVMTNARRFGRIRVQQDPVAEAPIVKLGFDPYSQLPENKAFQEMLTRRKSPIKGLLLNQAFAAGVGNWIADEVLYQARIDPRRRACELDAAEVRRLRGKLRSVINKAVAVDAVKTRFPKGWLFHRRWGKDEKAETVDGNPIKFETICGRTTAWVPSLQR